MKEEVINERKNRKMKHRRFQTKQDLAQKDRYSRYYRRYCKAVERQQKESYLNA